MRIVREAGTVLNFTLVEHQLWAATTPYHELGRLFAWRYDLQLCAVIGEQPVLVILVLAHFKRVIWALMASHQPRELIGNQLGLRSSMDLVLGLLLELIDIVHAWTLRILCKLITDSLVYGIDSK